MDKKLFLVLLCVIICIEARKSTRSRGSGSGRGTSSRKSNPQPSPTSLSYPQPSAAKPSLFGWQEKSASKQSVPNWQAKPSNGQHSYPSSNTGLSGNNAKQPTKVQENQQKSNAPVHQAAPQSAHPNNQPSHSYPASNGLSGSSGPGSHPGSSGGNYPQQQGSGLSGAPGGGYPQQHGSGLPGSPGGGYPSQGSGLSGSGAGYQHQPGSGLPNTGVAPPPYSGYRPGSQNVNNNYGNNYNQQRGPPPPYHNYGPSYGGYGGGAGYNPGPQMPGYFGNYGNNNGRGFGGMSRTGSALTGVGIAGAGVGTIVTGLALWNLARSTGQHRHTVIYDNRGQPVAVAPADNSTVAVDPMLANLVNCSLTISNENKTEILAIPCAIATSFSPDADVKLSEDGSNATDNTKCIITVLTKTGKEYMTTIPCATLLNSAAENNVTEPEIIENETNASHDTLVPPPDNKNHTNEPTALRLTDDAVDKGVNNVTVKCDPQPGDIRDPINPCFAVTHDLSVIPLQSTENPINKE